MLTYCFFAAGLLGTARTSQTMTCQNMPEFLVLLQAACILLNKLMNALQIILVQLPYLSQVISGDLGFLSRQED